jgi:hypothetical protein
MAPGWAGGYLRRGGAAFIFINAGDATPRKRFSLAHELGHHQLGHEPIAETWDAIYADDRPPTEVQANSFAAEFLAPKPGVQRWYEETGRPAINLDVVCRLAARFGISAQAARYRLDWAGLLRGQPELVARLDGEISAGEHERLIPHLDIVWPDDALAELHGAGPRAPETGMLGALLRGDVAIEAAADAVGRGAADLGRIVEDSGISC